MELLSRIQAAFPIAPIPEEPLLESSFLNPKAQEDEGATEYFSGKAWKGLDPNDLSWHRAALYMFKPHVHRYYLPAFMTACVEYPRPSGSITESLLFHFASYEEPFWWERLRVLTPAQCDATCAYLEHTSDVAGWRLGYHARALAGLSLARCQQS